MAARYWKVVTQTWSGRLAVCAVGLHQYDTHFRYERFNRNLRSIGAAVGTLVDYKWTLVREPERLEELHERVAKRWYDVCCANAGLYIKLGQQIATMNHILPPAYLKYFSQLNDQAPSVDYSVVSRIVAADFGVSSPDDVFDEFDRTPVASASIAQVHKAKLKDGSVVAVKVQKPEIAVQLPWDLACFRLLVFSFEKIFDLPMYWTCDSVCDVLYQETDFVCEARNSELVASDFEHLPGGGGVHVPAIHWDTTTKRVMTMEWIEGTPISDLTRLRAEGYKIQELARIMVESFSHQIFVSGFVHADPHPGNILVRRKPGTEIPQLVLLDHGCYLSTSEEFRKDYCRLWKAMVLMDEGELTRICKAWGVADSEFFASLQLLKPYTPKRGGVHLNSTTREDVLKFQVEAFDRVKALLGDSERVPRELILLGRNLNIVRANNKGMGSPVNRVNIMAKYASIGLDSGYVAVGKEGVAGIQREEWRRKRMSHQPPAPCQTLVMQDCDVGNDIVQDRGWVRAKLELISFRSRLAVISCLYYLSQWWGQASALLLGRKLRGFEEALEDSIAQTFEAKLGLKFNFDDGVEKCFG